MSVMCKKRKPLMWGGDQIAKEEKKKKKKNRRVDVSVGIL